jgi:opacity protein-like surface antigen
MLSSILALVPVLVAGAQPPAPAAAPSESAPKSLTALDATAGASTPGARSSVDGDDLSLLADLQAQGMMDRRNPPPPSASSMKRPFWPVGHTVMQGFLGAYEWNTVERSGGDTPDVDGSDDDLSQLPAIGGGGQYKLLGNHLDFGFEAMISFGWRANATAFAAGGGGAVVAVDVDMFLIDLYGGPFLSMFLGDRVRVYGAAGPLMQWAEFDQNGENIDDSGSGFGTGWYARTGLELRVRPGLMVGGGIRWTDSSIDLNNGLGDLDLEGFQWAFTVSTGI